MKVRHLYAAAVLLLGAACTESEVFYSTTYPVVRVDVSVKLEKMWTETDEQGEPVENPLVETIRQEVLAAAPVRAGGGYALDYIRHDGGMLEVRTALDGEQLQGAFLHTPGSDAFTFVYADAAYVYTLSDYTADDGTVRVLLTADLTEAFRSRYPYVQITEVLRQEYTSHDK